MFLILTLFITAGEVPAPTTANNGTGRTPRASTAGNGGRRGIDAGNAMAVNPLLSANDT
jgi:hypothetical protein